MEEEMQQIMPDADLPPAAIEHKPSHPDLFRVKFVTGSYASSLIAVKVRPFTSQWIDPSQGGSRFLSGVQTR